MKTAIEVINKQIKNLVLYRGTLEDITKKIRTIGLDLDAELTPFEEEAIIEENDLGFNVNLGEINDHYLDFEIYMLPTNEKNSFIITEVNQF